MQKPSSSQSSPLVHDNIQTIEYGTTSIQFNLSYSSRETLEIAVYPDQTVWVTAPEESSLDKIYEKVRHRRRWITKQIKHFDRFENEQIEFEYVSGETHRYLGKQYRLKVLQPENEEESVKLKRGYFFIHSKQKGNPKHVKAQLDAWYREKAEEKFRDRLQDCLDMVQKYGIGKPNELKVYHMDKRWGSFTASGNILLNPDLIKHPVYCIDYVIIHELCHIKHPQHDSKFYDLLKKVLPDWQKRKHKLEGYK
ncbi:SprT family zinc-dependent metalloprotease [Gracilimonas sp.]|uniref:M48 family metallopeptidase n=1 Tax=Gracilimonas sp. TaxID=1974203 RepID=UPI001B117617|nr:SprT family zinc-dependent metalloprotease [Gracilimonas sp.]MBO6615975.1 M48 family metallopeptidase [Gracilimonas sp.]